MGAPSKFKQATADAICAALATGKSLREILKADGMPGRATVHRWLEADEAFRDQYASAREQGLDVWADEIKEIADTPSPGVVVTETPDGTTTKHADMIEHRRLQVDARKWLLSKLVPKKYGDKVDVTSGGEKLTVCPMVYARPDA